MPCNDSRTWGLVADAPKTLVDEITESDRIVDRKKCRHFESEESSRVSRNRHEMAPRPIDGASNSSSSSASSCYDRPRRNDLTNSSSSLILILERPEFQEGATRRHEKMASLSNDDENTSEAPSRGLSVKATTSSIENLAKKAATRCRRRRSALATASPRNNRRQNSTSIPEGQSSPSSSGHETSTGFVATSTLTKSADCGALSVSRNQSRAAAKWRLQPSAEASERQEGRSVATPHNRQQTISVAAIRGTNVALESLRDEDEAARRLGAENYYASAPSLNAANYREKSESSSRRSSALPLVLEPTVPSPARSTPAISRMLRKETLPTSGGQEPPGAAKSSPPPYVLAAPDRRPRDLSTFSQSQNANNPLKTSSSFTAPKAMRKHRHSRVLTSLHASLGQLPINASSCATSATPTILGEAATSLENLQISGNHDDRRNNNEEGTLVPVRNGYSSETKNSPNRPKNSPERIQPNVTSNAPTSFANKSPLRVLALPEVSHSPNNVANTFRNNLANSGYSNNPNNNNCKNARCSHLGGTCACSATTTTSSQTSSTLTRTSNHLVNGVVATSSSSWTNSVEQETDYVVDPVQGNAYHKGQFLGKGGFARVYLMTDVANGNQYACKIIPKNRMQKIHIQKALRGVTFSIHNFLPRTKRKFSSIYIRIPREIAREIMIHKELNHVNVVQMHHYFEDNINVYMLLEPCPRKSLMHVLKYRGKVTEPEARYYMRQMVTGVAYIHSQKVVHRDLKPGNMFLSDGMIVKIGDFGLATRPDGQRRRVTICGTPNYIAPEVLYKQAYSYEADVWALGCILYALLAGQPPFDTSTLKETYARICNNRYKKLDESVVSRSGQDLIRWLLQPIPELRPSLERVKEHAYLTMEYVPTRLSHTCCYRVPLLTGASNEQTLVPRQLPTSGHGDNDNAAISRIVQRNNAEMAARTRESSAASTIATPTTATEATNSTSKVRTNNVTIGTEHAKNHHADAQKKPKVGNWLLRKLPKLPGFRQRLTRLLCPEAKKPDSLMMHRAIEACLAEIRCTRAHNNPVVVDRITPLFVTKWIDYSNKYGLGFQLSDRSVGVLFNDSTKMSYTQDRRRVEYATTEDEVTRYRRENDVPASMEEKLELLRHFTHYMDNFLTNGGEIREQRGTTVGKFTRTSQSTSGNVPRMRRWLRTDKAIVMELTVPLLQVNFFVDHSKIVVSEGQRGRGYLVTYIDASRQAATYWLNDLRDVGCTAELYERLHYVSKVIGELENDAIFETATNLVQQHRNKTLRT